MTFSENISEHGFLKEAVQAGAPQEVARGAVREQTEGKEEGAGTQRLRTLKQKLEPKTPNIFGTISSAVRGT